MRSLWPLNFRNQMSAISRVAINPAGERCDCASAFIFDADSNQLSGHVFSRALRSRPVTRGECTAGGTSTSSRSFPCKR